jgi:hypothetical protein
MFKVTEQVSIVWNSTITNRSQIKLDIAKTNNGLWTKSETQVHAVLVVDDHHYFILDETNIQVMSTNENITILTFCDSDRLFSLVLTDDDEPYTDENYNQAVREIEIFRHYGIYIGGIKQFSVGNVVSGSGIMVWVCAMMIAFESAII